MDRIYTNHCHGERRIHIEIDENEIEDLLDDLAGVDAPKAFTSTKDLLRILRESSSAFADDRSRDAQEATS
ncbi:hypothetical protein [Streptomyces sp. Amel2xC10]|uniref:hypothetical protein n=1 Tax=Streptomyces sp. Amel2xC10 TaxID=1305826 RepID=UPI000A08759C|nr:hypothetical protein [Streptomyces sp. Amel2xC10]SMF86461.1 hypothetical protein SAMN02745830_07175 [Streptomyces sp. Amel2xC10]